MNSIPAAIQREGFQSLFFGHPDATYVFDTAGAFIQCNDRLVELTGYSRDELHQMSFEPIVHPDDLEAVASEFYHAVSGQNRRYQSRGITKAGELFMIDVTNIPVRDNDGDVVAVIGIARDIGDLQQAEGARLRMEGQLHSTLDQMAIGIGFVNRQWRFTFVNAKGRQYLQHDLETLGASSLWEIFPGLEDTAFGPVYRRAMEQREVATTRSYSDVFDRWFEVTAFPTAEGIAIHILDVTEDQKTKLQLEQSARRLHSQGALLDAARDAIYVRDLDGRITYWNRGAEQLFGWTADELGDKIARELLVSDPAEFDAATAEVLRSGFWTGELEQVTDSGQLVAVDCRWQLIRDEDDQLSIFAVDSDITEWKRGEEKRNRAQRLESLGTLAGGIAHDLNNVLTPILMSAQLLSANEKDGGRLALFGSIESGVKRGADMVRQVLSFARGEEGQRSTLDVGNLFTQVHDFCRDTLPKSIRFQIDAPAGLWPVSGDQTQLFQVLVNLVTNARDSMSTGGNLTIRGRNVESDQSRNVVLEIEDSGSGMDTDTASKIFEPFFTTKAGSGTGLGLSTSMTIIRNHGGDLDVYSEPGHGSRFRIRLPASFDEVQHPSEDPSLADPFPRGNNERVLVVDDEATIREIACQTLEANGYRTLAAANGLEAVEIMKRGDVTIDLVFTDMMMPEMDGAATAAYFLANHPGVAVIAASGLNANGGVARAAHSGVKSFLSKPFTATELLTSVRQTLDTWGEE